MPQIETVMWCGSGDSGINRSGGTRGRRPRSKDALVTRMDGHGSQISALSLLTSAVGRSQCSSRRSQRTPAFSTRKPKDTHSLVRTRMPRRITVGRRRATATVLFYRCLRALRYAARAFHRYDAAFKDHARRGVLPALSVIEPRYFDLTGTPADDDHPAHDVANGQRLVKDVYEALRASPQWNQTLLIVTYDKHGGFYDHVATPTAGVPRPDGIRGPPPFFFKFDRLGVMVPTIMVSPWIKKGTVVGRAVGPTDTSEFEHSSIPATIKNIFNLSSDFLTKRDAWWAGRAAGTGFGHRARGAGRGQRRSSG